MIKRFEVNDLDNNNSPRKFTYLGLNIELISEVYEPAEDTFQILEALEIKSGDQVFDIGTGCGLIALDCCRRGANVVCSDVNPFAVELAYVNYNNNKTVMKGDFSVRKGDLYSVLKNDEIFDVIVFNPPYLPTKSDDRVGGSGWFDIATDGGIDGLRVIKRFIDGLSMRLSKNGKAYFVFSSLSIREKLEKYLSNAGCESKVLLSRPYNDEILDIYCVYFK